MAINQIMKKYCIFRIATFSRERCKYRHPIKHWRWPQSPFILGKLHSTTKIENWTQTKWHDISLKAGGSWVTLALGCNSGGHVSSWVTSSAGCPHCTSSSLEELENERWFSSMKEVWGMSQDIREKLGIHVGGTVFCWVKAGKALMFPHEFQVCSHTWTSFHKMCEFVGGGDQFSPRSLTSAVSGPVFSKVMTLRASKLRGF